jgi:hypothetical protein
LGVLNVRSHVLGLTAAVLCAGGPVWAQPFIDDSVATASTLGADQRADVDEFVEFYADKLTDDDSAQRSLGRRSLLAPLKQDGVSVDFRMTYSDRLMPTLERVVADDDTKIAINGLHIAGALATDDAVELLIDAANAPGGDMRYTAARAIMETFSQVDRSWPAIGEPLLQELAVLLEARLSVEDEPLVFDVVGKALSAAGRLEREQWSDVAEQARVIQGRVSAQRMQRLNPGPDDFWIIVAIARTLESQRLLITEDFASADVARQAALLAGQCVSYAVARAEAGDLTNDDRLVVWDLVKRAESLITWSHTVLEPGTNAVRTVVAGNLAIDGDPTRFDDDAFVEEARAQLIGPDGALCQEPFGFDASDFAR